MRPSSAQIVRAWAASGCCFGALFGALVAVAAPVLAIIAAPVGAVIGGLCGLAVGTLDGVVLALLNRLASAATVLDNRRFIAFAAAATTALAGYLLHHAIFASATGPGVRFTVIAVPVIAEAVLAAWLSHRLPPATPHLPQ